MNQPNTTLRATLGRLGAALLLLIVAACGVSNVVIEGNFPTPNVNKIPLSVAVIYDDALREHFYIEYSETGREEINIESGNSHIQLFNAVLPAMFDQVISVASFEDAAGQNVDAVFVPEIEEFQLALPAKTKLDVYEVWIKYNMRLLTSEGEVIADWVLTAYGKTPTGTLGTVRFQGDSINQAAVVALRDLATSFSLTFAQVPEVQDWLNNL